MTAHGRGATSDADRRRCRHLRRRAASHRVVLLPRQRTHSAASWTEAPLSLRLTAVNRLSARGPREPLRQHHHRGREPRRLRGLRLMALDAIFPAASELVMLYAGAIAAGAFGSQGVRSFGVHFAPGVGALLVMALAGTLGYLVGALIGWAIGRYGGRPLLERHGRWFHLSPAKLDRAEAWFDRWGNLGVLARPGHADRPLVRLHPGRRLRDAARAVHVPHARRLGDLGVRLRRGRLWARHLVPQRSTTPSATSSTPSWSVSCLRGVFGLSVEDEG